VRTTGSIVVRNANIITLEPAQPRAHALAVRDGVIVAVGDDDAVAPYLADSRVIDAAGATVVPGLIDTHVHFTLTGLGLFAVDLGGVPSLATALERIAASASSQTPGSLVLALGYEPRGVAEERFPTPAELDAAAGGRPVYVMESGGHWCAVNDAALALLDLDTAAPGLDRDAAGERTGVLRDAANTAAFTALWRIFAAQVGLERAFQAGAQEAARHGLTTLHALDDLENVHVLLACQDQLPVRVVPYTQCKDVAAVQGLGLRQIGGCGQVMVDGDFGPHTAALLEPYADQPDTCGVLYWQADDLDRYVAEAHAAGMQVALHCLGSGAIEQLLNAYARALAVMPRADHRHRIEHFQLPAPGQAERARRLGITLAMQPSFNHYWPHTAGYPQVIGPARAQQLDPIRSALAAGLEVAFGSDSPVTPMRPLQWMHAAANHSNPDQRISVAQALHCCTLAGARLAFQEHDRGSLAAGKLGDFVLLGADPHAVSPDAIQDIPVLATVVGGRLVAGALLADEL
jgi:predicted amidohydrolase YtcJ